MGSQCAPFQASRQCWQPHITVAHKAVVYIYKLTHCLWGLSVGSFMTECKRQRVSIENKCIFFCFMKCVCVYAYFVFGSLTRAQSRLKKRQKTSWEAPVHFIRHSLRSKQVKTNFNTLKLKHIKKKQVLIKIWIQELGWCIIAKVLTSSIDWMSLQCKGFILKFALSISTISGLFVMKWTII